MLDSNHAGHPDDDDEWQTTFSSWDRYGKIVVDFSPVLSITYLSTETWHGNSNFENNSNTHHTKKRKTKRKIQKRNSFTEENYRRLQISLPVHIQNACSTFRILVSKAIILGLATKRKEKKMLMESHKFRRTFWGGTLDLNRETREVEQRGGVCTAATKLDVQGTAALAATTAMASQLHSALQKDFNLQQNSNKMLPKSPAKYTNPRLQTSISLSLSLSLSFAKQLSSLHNCAEQEQKRRDLSFTAVTTVKLGGKFWQPSPR